MSDDVYQQAITALAKAAVGAGFLARADARVTLDNPLCGDRVTLEIALDGDRVAGLGHDVRGCLLCRAAASLIGQRAPGHTAGEIAAVQSGLHAMLKEAAGAVADWPELAAFQPVARHKSRHDCVLLPFQALTQALDQAVRTAQTR
jgi:nitrogen fixation NifU-like protein